MKCGWNILVDLSSPQSKVCNSLFCWCTWVWLEILQNPSCESSTILTQLTKIPSSCPSRSQTPIDSTVLSGPVSSIWVDSKSNTQVPRLSTSKDPLASTNHICFVFLAQTRRHGQDAIYKLYSRPRDSSTRHSCNPGPTIWLFSHQTSGSSHTDNLKEIFSRKM